MHDLMVFYLQNLPFWFMYYL